MTFWQATTGAGAKSRLANEQTAKLQAMIYNRTNFSGKGKVLTPLDFYNPENKRTGKALKSDNVVAEMSKWG